MTVESTVIVLGKDSNETILNQMRELKVALASKGYQAVLVKELSEIPEWSNEQKVRAWAAAARFCVMIDDEPSGHDAEYIMLREQGVGLAVLRPRKRGSTWMIGSDKTEHIQIFEYDLSPLEVVEPAVVWAENLLATRRTRYNGTYPWRQEK